MARTQSRVNAQRVNITLPAEVHRLLKEVAQERYGGNLSRFLADAGVFYAGAIRATQEPTNVVSGTFKGE
ncbi:MAG: hypothetical protein GX162_02475 [Firmicutes bacterium]|jgi:hypothetical protein|nr:hypothetical protein [Bacillota bacterium]